MIRSLNALMALFMLISFAAVSEAQSRARKLYEEEVGRVAGGLGPLNLGSLFGGL